VLLFDSLWHNLGEALKPQEWSRFMNFLSSFHVRAISMYGMSECLVVIGCQLHGNDYTNVPIGNSLPGVRCLLINEQGRIINNNDKAHEIGQIHIGG
jgi:acyl-coenzyme A synthetase/AMP-(fatty) acid ligase